MVQTRAIAALNQRGLESGVLTVRAPLIVATGNVVMFPKVESLVANAHPALAATTGSMAAPCGGGFGHPARPAGKPSPRTRSGLREFCAKGGKIVAASPR